MSEFVIRPFALSVSHSWVVGSKLLFVVVGLSSSFPVVVACRVPLRQVKHLSRECGEFRILTSNSGPISVRL